MPRGHSQLLYLTAKYCFGGKYTSLRAGNNPYSGHLTESPIFSHDRESESWSLHPLGRAPLPRPHPTQLPLNGPASKYHHSGNYLTYKLRRDTFRPKQSCNGQLLHAFAFWVKVKFPSRGMYFSW